MEGDKPRPYDLSNELPQDRIPAMGTHSLSGFLG